MHASMVVWIIAGSTPALLTWVVFAKATRLDGVLIVSESASQRKFQKRLKKTLDNDDKYGIMKA
jgi:hypothetical protein